MHAIVHWKDCVGQEVNLWGSWIAKGRFQWPCLVSSAGLHVFLPTDGEREDAYSVRCPGKGSRSLSSCCLRNMISLSLLWLRQYKPTGCLMKLHWSNRAQISLSFLTTTHFPSGNSSEELSVSLQQFLCLWVFYRQHEWFVMKWRSSTAVTKEACILVSDKPEINFLYFRFWPQNFTSTVLHVGLQLRWPITVVCLSHSSFLLPAAHPWLLS